MLTRLRPRSIYDVMAAIAFFAAVAGGSAYAAATIGSSDIKRNAVLSRHIKNGQVKHRDLSANTVATGNVIDHSLLARDFKPGQLLPRPERWHNVAPGSTVNIGCPSATGVFCSEDTPLGTKPWRNYGSGFVAAAFYKDQLGIVHLKGLVVPPVLYTPNYPGDPQTRTIFQLPVGFRPQRSHVFASVGSSADGQDVAAGRVDVRPDGFVVTEEDCQMFGTPGTDNNCSAYVSYLTLDGVSYRPGE